jgi:hypothetical protein
VADLTTVKRLHYFDHQFLRAGDFTAEQDYQVAQRRLHNRALHTSGVAEGLDVTFQGGATSVTVTSGAAFDSLGREIVLAADQTVELSGYDAGDLYLTISYDEQQTDVTTETGATGNTRWTEQPKFGALKNLPGNPGQQLVLALVTRSGTKEVTAVDTSVRQIAGAVGSSLDLLQLALRDPNIVSTSWVRMRLAAAGRALLSGSLEVSEGLTVDGDAQVNGTLIAAGPLAANGGVSVTGDATVSGGIRLTGSTGVTLQRSLIVMGTPETARARSKEVVGALGFLGYGVQHGQLAFRAGAGFELVDVSASGPQIGYATDSLPFADLRVRNLIWSGGSGLVDDQGGSIELGGSNSVAGIGTPYVDFHFNGKRQDYSVRLVNDADGQLTAVGAFRATGLLSVGTLPPNPQRNPYFTAGEVHVGGPGGGFSFSNRNPDDTKAFDNVAGNRWVLYSDAQIARLWTAQFGDRLRVTTSGDLWVAGASNIFRVWQTVVSITNGAPNNASSVSVNFDGGFSQVYAVIPVVTGFSVFAVNAQTYARTGLHAPDVNGIPQHVWARVTSFSTNAATIQAYCSESNAANESDNVVIVTVVVLGKGV